MGSRRDKVLAVARLLRAGSGITGIASDGSTIEGPHPYGFTFFTGREQVPFMRSILSMPKTGTHMHVWYTTGAHQGPQDALVTMRLGEFLPLLEAHYNAEVLPRLKGGE
jgi:hypothetical protein